ncbi:MAG: ATP-binding protein [Candidatus Kapaibacterium sp.]
MKRIKLTLYSKLLMLAAALELILGVIVVSSLYVFDTLNERDIMRRAENVMLESCRLRTEFSKKKDLAIRDKFHSRMQKFEEIIRIAEHNEELAALLMLQNDYHKLFENYVEMIQTRGLNENLGVEGHFRKNVHNIEDILRGVDDRRVYVDMLQARRSEKDFIMRRSDKYIERVGAAVDSLVAHSADMRIPEAKRIEIIKLSQVYYLSFLELVRIFQRLEEQQKNLEFYENKIRTQLEIMVEERAEKASVIQNAQMGVVAFSVLLGVALSVVLGRQMTRPLVGLQKAAGQLAGGDYNATVDVRGNDEIADLGRAFNSMVINIRNSSETIMQQQERMKDQNIELELLAEDLKQSFNNLSVLSNIGQSITSALNFEDLFEKLYAELSTVIDSSGLCIGLYCEEAGTIEYRLVMENGQRRPPLTVGISGEPRLDALAVVNHQEIFINEFDKDIEYLVRDYEWAARPESIRAMSEHSNSGIYIPITAENKVIGILSIESQDSRVYKQHHLDMVRNLASYIAIALLNAKSFEEIRSSHDEIRRAHESLQKTQDQLIQAEKLASLGQLTTGIAHEIRNPLNFINNFSDGTRELCMELMTEVDALNGAVASEKILPVREVISEIAGHLETIANNGRRIDNIVKSMMEHARGGSGRKIPTSVNEFVKDYARMAYKGFSSQYKSFRAKIRTEFDESAPMAAIRQQDLSRVITNLVDNACYSMNKKLQTKTGEYHPEITINTKDMKDIVELRIRDNGCGMPREVMDKIFNPFFTTKPAGDGTGLGLSLSYDIITNGHSGEMTVKSEEGNYAEFIIRLPKS